MQKKPNAFTMIELLVSATVIILLTAIALVSFSQASISSRNAKRKADLETMRQALTLYKQDHAYYSASATPSFDGLVTDLYTGEYLSESAIKDPKDVAQYTYKVTCSALSGTNCVKLTLTAVLEPDSTNYDLIAL